MAGTAGHIGESDFSTLAAAKTIVWLETLRNTLGRHMAEFREEQGFDWCDAAPQFFANCELDVLIEVHMEDLQGTGPRHALDLVQTNLPQKIRFKIWTVYEVDTKYEHLKRERVLHNDRTEITPNPKYLGVVLHSTRLTSCKPAPTPSVTGSVKHEPESADSTVKLLEACSTCQWIAEMCNSRQMLVRWR